MSALLSAVALAASAAAASAAASWDAEAADVAPALDAPATDGANDASTTNCPLVTAGVLEIAAAGAAAD
jgi:hypothetical protein